MSWLIRTDWTSGVRSIDVGGGNDFIDGFNTLTVLNAAPFFGQSNIFDLDDNEQFFNPKASRKLGREYG